MGKTRPEDCFSQRQIADYKEAFDVIDKDSDGEISVKELKQCFNDLGLSAKEPELKEMIAEAGGALDFPAFLNMFANKLNGTDEESVMIEAFKLLDSTASGSLAKDELREMLTQMGRPTDRLTEQEVPFFFSLCQTSNLLNLSYTHKIVQPGSRRCSMR